MKYQNVARPEVELTMPIFNQDYQKVCSELKALSKKLSLLLPDPSIGPEERLERLARVVPSSIVNSQNVKTARTKLNTIKSRLNELVPDENLSATEKLEHLLSLIDKKLPGNQRLFLKLEEMGDNRVSDIGR